VVRYGRLLIWVMTLVMASTAAGCAKPGIDTPRPPLNLPVADDSVTAVVAALSALDVSSAPLDSSSVLAQDDVAQIVSGMDGYLPRVTAGPLVYAKDQPEATLTLTYTWAFPGGDWTYQAPVRIVHSQGWKLAWSPSVIHPALDATNRLVHTRTPAKRAGITGNNGVALVEEHTVVRVGIDKTLIGADQWDAQPGRWRASGSTPTRSPQVVRRAACRGGHHDAAGPGATARSRAAGGSQAMLLERSDERSVWSAGHHRDHQAFRGGWPATR
jgi:hypothetical protein